jgi:immune inhibitor A
VVGEHIYLWVEDGAEVDNGDLQALATEFDTNIYAQVRDLWGSEATPGVDGDPRIYGLFLHGLGSSVAAYFASDHTYPREVVPVSNEHEMFFFNLDTFGFGYSVQEVGGIVAHEFQHMIRANLQINSETWLNEGLSEFTQYELYDYIDSSIYSFLAQPGTQLNDWNADPAGRAANYGAAALFFIYLEQRYGLDAVRALSAERDERALQAVDDVLVSLGEPGVDAFFGDWALANALLDTSYGDGRYGYPGLDVMPVSPITISEYPFEQRSSVNQYATTYYAFSGLDGANALDLHLDAPASVGLIPTSAPSGTHVWYSNRGDMGDARLTRAFDLSDTTEATLNYRVWYDTESLWDYGYVMVSDNDGTSWDILPTLHTTTDDPQHVAYGAGYTGMSGGWLDESISLDAYAGEEIWVRFEVITDDAVTRPGLAIDDVNIPEIDYADDFEADDGGWQAEGWLLTDNRLGQGGWLQVVQRRGEETLDVQRWGIDRLDYQIELMPEADTVLVALSPFAPVTTVPMMYALKATLS